MILSTHGIVGSQIVQGYDADYQSILDYATTQGYTFPSAGQQIKQNKLLVDLKAAGIWSKLDTFAVFATDGSSDFALIDWKRLMQYTAVNSPTFTTNIGFQGNGTSSYIDLNYTSTTNWVNASQNNTSVFAYNFSDVFPSTQILIGSLNTSSLVMDPRNSSNIAGIRIYNNPTVATANSNGSGFFLGSRISSSTVNFYRNGSLLISNTSSTSLSITTPTYCLRLGNTYTLARPSILGIGASISAGENTNLNNAISTYISSL